MYLEFLESSSRKENRKIDAGGCGVKRILFKLSNGTYLCVYGNGTVERFLKS